MMRRIFRTVVASVALVCAVAAGFLLGLSRTGMSARPEPGRVETQFARRFRRFAVPREMRERKNPVPLTPEVLVEARHHFADHCAGCHGNDGSGNTAVGRKLYPRAPDMRLAETQSLTDGEIYHVIHNGIRMTGMPAWGEEGGEDLDSWELVHFIRHLPKLTSQELDEMKKDNPRSAAEILEEREEEELLRGGPTERPAENRKRKPR